MLEKTGINWTSQKWVGNWLIGPSNGERRSFSRTGLKLTLITIYLHYGPQQRNMRVCWWYLMKRMAQAHKELWDIVVKGSGRPWAHRRSKPSWYSVAGGTLLSPKSPMARGSTLSSSHVVCYPAALQRGAGLPRALLQPCAWRQPELHVGCRQLHKTVIESSDAGAIH